MREMILACRRDEMPIDCQARHDGFYASLSREDKAGAACSKIAAPSAARQDKYALNAASIALAARPRCIIIMP